MWFRSKQQPKPIPKPLANPIVASPNELNISSPTHSPSTSAWTCNSCTLQNSIRDMKCIACGSPALSNGSADIRSSRIDFGGKERVPNDGVKGRRDGDDQRGPEGSSDRIGSDKRHEGGRGGKGREMQMRVDHSQVHDKNALGIVQECGLKLREHSSEDALLQAKVLFADGTEFDCSFAASIEDLKSRLLPLLEISSRSSEYPDSGTAQFPILTNGEFSGVPNVYAESKANAGLAGGERIQSGRDGTPMDNSLFTLSKSRKSSAQSAVGPPQRGAREEIKVSDRNAQLSDGGGARVNQQSDKRVYDLGNYERSVLIDPARHTRESAKEAKEDRTGDMDASGTGVPVEVAAVSAKIRNIHRVAGERVKEMDHFVADVRVPVVRVSLDDGSKVAPLRKTDLGAYIQSAVRSDTMSNSGSVSFRGTHGEEVTVLVEQQYLSKGGPGQSTEEAHRSHVQHYCQIFYGVLEHVFEILCVELSSRTLQLYYMTTMRADELVCAAAADHDGKLFINAMVFQQQCSDEGGKDGASKPAVSAPRWRWREMLAYWVTRVSGALAKDKGRAIGLYDNTTRKRFYDKLLHLTTSSSSSSSSSPPLSGSGNGAFASPWEEAVTRISSSAGGGEEQRGMSLQLLQRSLADAVAADDTVMQRRCRDRISLLQAPSSDISGEFEFIMPAVAATKVVQGRLPPSATTPAPAPTPSSSHNAPSFTSYSSATALPQTSYKTTPTTPAEEEAVAQLLEFFAAGGWGRDELLWVLRRDKSLEAAMETIFDLQSPQIIKDHIQAEASTAKR